MPLSVSLLHPPPAPPIPPKSIPPGIVRKLKQHRDPELQTSLKTLWPDTGKPTSAEMDAQIRKRWKNSEATVWIGMFGVALILGLTVWEAVVAH